MATDRERRRRQAVARRRRSVALLALLVVAAIVVVALMWRPWEGAAAPAAEPAPSASTSPSASPTPSPSSTQQYTPIGGIPESGEGGAAACTAEQVLITPITDAVTYAPDQQVQMSFQIQNVSGEPCRLNVGTTQQAYEVRTGDQVVFRSSDCPVDQVDQIVELAPGVPQRTLPVTWDRTSSSPETCASPREPVVGGGASYHLSITVSGIPSASEQQIILS